MVYWNLERYREMTDGEMAEAFEDLARKENAFGYAIEYIKPKRQEQASPRANQGSHAAPSRARIQSIQPAVMSRGSLKY